MEKKKKKKNKSYDRAFKENAVQLSFERSNQSALARELGINPKNLSRWREEYEQFQEKSFQGSGVARLSDEDKEIRRLRKELHDKKLELEILKKAMGIISQSDR
jgi:transposase